MGGPAQSTYLTLCALQQAGAQAEIIMPPLAANEELVAADATIHYTRPMANKRLGYVPGMRRTLERRPVYDIYHVQGLWQYFGHAVVRHAQRQGRPWAVTLRGMLYPGALAHSSFAKRVSLALWQGADLQRAACTHATCMEEMEHYRNLGFTNPVAVIPNPVATEGIAGRPIPRKTKLQIGYLGRVHPRKRIERLIYAFDALRAKLGDAELVIIGEDDKHYETFLRKETERLGLKNVRFAGFLTGKAKDEAVSALSCLAVPSDFENFGMIVAEALARGVPVIASRGMPWQELEQYGCGWWISNDQDTINQTLEAAVSLSEQERMQMGMNGMKLIKEKYSVGVIGMKMKQLYEWILNGGDKPEFVYE